jgi:hypothetical protein
LIDIFNNNNLIHTDDVGRQLNNFSVTDSEAVRRAYALAVAPDYFLSTIGDTVIPTPVLPVRPQGLTVSRGILRISSWARCYSESFTVAYHLDGRVVAAVREPGPREADLNFAQKGAHRLTALVHDDRGRVAAQTDTLITVS